MRRKVRTHTEATLLATFWEQVEKLPSGCWMWTGYAKNGYGAISFRDRMLGCHRLSWELHFGPIPEGLMVLHHCDRRRCVNPGHLFVGTGSDNMRDKEQKGRGNHSIGETRPTAKLTEQDVAEIRRLRLSGWKGSELAEKFPCSAAQLLRVARGVAWKHVTAPVAPYFGRWESPTQYVRNEV